MIVTQHTPPLELYVVSVVDFTPWPFSETYIGVEARLVDVNGASEGGVISTGLERRWTKLALLSDGTYAVGHTDWDGVTLVVAS